MKGMLLDPLVLYLCYQDTSPCQVPHTACITIAWGNIAEMHVSAVMQSASWPKDNSQRSPGA